MSYRDDEQANAYNAADPHRPTRQRRQNPDRGRGPVPGPGRPRPQKPSQRPGRSRVTRRVMAGFVILALVLAASAGAVWWRNSASVKRLAKAMKPSVELQKQLDIELKPTKKQDRFVYILLMGDDRRPGESRARTDTLIVVAVDKKSGDAAMVSIPRDSRVEVPGYGMTKINHAGAYGGPPLSIRTVNQLTGLSINHYVRIDFTGLERLIDQVGGVDVFVQASDADPGSVQHLNGRQAVSFVRQRKTYAAGDFARMDNQQRVLLQMSKALRSPQTIARIPNIVSALEGHLDTDMSTDELTALANKMSGRPIASMVLTGKSERIENLSYVVLDEAQKDHIFSALRNGKLPAKQ